MKNKKIAAAMLCTMLGMTSFSMAFGTNDRMDFNEKIALTGQTGYDTQESAAPTETASNGITELEDEEVMESTYYAYGEGCFFIMIDKGNGDIAEGQDETEKGDVDNPEESTASPTGTPEITETPQVDSETTKDSMVNTGIMSSKALIDACATEQEKEKVEAGANLAIRVTFADVTENEMDEKDVSLMGEVLDDYMASNPNFSFGNYVKITFEKKDLTSGKWKTIDKLNSPVKLCVDIVSDYQEKNGSYCMIQLKGDTYEKLKDEDDYAQVITFSTEESSVYGVCCDEKTEKTTATPIPTKKPNFLNGLMSNTICLWHWFMVAMFIAGATWLLAINSFKIRTIFLVIMELISLLLAILGSCKLDWPLAIVFMLCMLAIHVVRTILKKKK
jgi:hypothetical protein